MSIRPRSRAVAALCGAALLTLATGIAAPASADVVKVRGVIRPAALASAQVEFLVTRPWKEDRTIRMGFVRSEGAQTLFVEELARRDGPDRPPTILGSYSLVSSKLEAEFGPGLNDLLFLWWEEGSDAFVVQQEGTVLRIEVKPGGMFFVEKLSQPT